jgi:lysophospholipase L1-like esterase
MQSRSLAKLVFTSLLPRLVDHYKTEKTITKVNAELKVLCRRKHFLFCNLYKHFLYKNSPDPTFAPSDGLHLNYAGTDLLRRKIINFMRFPCLARLPVLDSIFLCLIYNDLLNEVTKGYL